MLGWSEPEREVNVSKRPRSHGADLAVPLREAKVPVIAKGLLSLVRFIAFAEAVIVEPSDVALSYLYSHLGDELVPVERPINITLFIERVGLFQEIVDGPSLHHCGGERKHLATLC
jgi:hypothetical protein